MAKNLTLKRAVLTKPTDVQANIVHANVVPLRLHRWVHVFLGVRHFVKDYNLAVILTLVFLALVLCAGVLRATQRASLANLLTSVTSITQDYDSLVSRDKTDAPVRNNVSDDQASAPQGSTGSFAIDTSGQQAGTTTPPAGGGSPAGGTGGGSGGGSGSSGATTPPPVFSAAIGFFNQTVDGTLECSKPQQQAKFCTKRYSFSAGVNTKNGPGTVGYGWRSNVSGANSDDSYAAASGSSQQTLTKSIAISCLSPGNYNMQFVVTSPNSVQSSSINFTHNCAGL